MNTKACRRCEIVKSVSEFGVSKQERDGLNPQCKECGRKAALAYHRANREKVLPKMRARYLENRERGIAKSTEWAKNNPEMAQARNRRYNAKYPEKVRSRIARWIAKNPDRAQAMRARYRAKSKESRRTYNHKYKRTNRATVNATTARRRTRLRHSFVARADPVKILTFYAEAQRLTALTGIEHHVDHIVPLTSKVVCGLHWEGNLQVMTSIENVKKGNKHTA